MRISDWSSDVCSSDLGRRLQAAVEGIAPGVVGAADEAPGAARLRHQPQTAMAADVVEDAQRAVMVTQQEQRQALELHRPEIARLRPPGAGADAGPGPGQPLVPLDAGEAPGGIGLVGQAAGLGTRPQPSLHRLALAQTGNTT